MSLNFDRHERSTWTTRNAMTKKNKKSNENRRLHTQLAFYINQSKVSAYFIKGFKSAEINIYIYIYIYILIAINNMRFRSIFYYETNCSNRQQEVFIQSNHYRNDNEYNNNNIKKKIKVSEQLARRNEIFKNKQHIRDANCLTRNQSNGTKFISKRRGKPTLSLFCS